MRRVLVTGDRNWTDHRYLVAVLDQLHAEDPISVLIEGCAGGADRMAGRHAPGEVPGTTDPGWAWARDVPGLHFPADWDKYHRAAGPIRNSQQLKEGMPDLVVAFHHDLSQSKGTADMVRKARAAGVPVVVHTGNI